MALPMQPPIQRMLRSARLEWDDFRWARLSHSRILFWRSIFSKSGVHFSNLALGCSGAVLLAAFSAGPAPASPAPPAVLSPLRTVPEGSASDGMPLRVQAQAEPLDFRVSDIAGPPGRPIPLKIDVPGGIDIEAGKLFIFTGIPQGVMLTPGGNFGDFWAVNASVVKDLAITTPPDFAGSFTVFITRSHYQGNSAKNAAITVTINRPDTTPTAATAAPTFPERTAPLPPSEAAIAPRAPSANEQMLMSRADATLRKGDVSGARVIYEYLAMQGSAAAAMSMGETYDPLVLKKLVVKGLTPDEAKARQWYEKAEKLGNGDARSRLNALAAK